MILYLNVASRSASSQNESSRFSWCRAARVALMRVCLSRSAKDFSCGWCGILLLYQMPSEL